MTPVQWLLLILIIAAVAVAYWYMRRHSGEDPWQDMEQEGGDSEYDFDRGESLGGDSYIVGVRTVGSTPEADAGEPPREPVLGAADEDRTAEPPAAGEPSWKHFGAQPRQAEPAQSAEFGRMRPQRAPAGEEKLFILHVAARDDRQFDGPEIHDALQEQKLKFGLHGIYHRITEANGVPESVYSVANMLKPGYLDPVDKDHLRTPGLTMFLVLPGPIEGAQAARDMLDTAQALAERLDGEVLDDKRSLLKAQTAQFMFDQVAEVDRQQRLQAHR